jgi:hypothetical protein
MGLWLAIAVLLVFSRGDPRRSGWFGLTILLVWVFMLLEGFTAWLFALVAIWIGMRVFDRWRTAPPAV